MQFVTRSGLLTTLVLVLKMFYHLRSNKFRGISYDISVIIDKNATASK